MAVVKLIHVALLLLLSQLLSDVQAGFLAQQGYNEQWVVGRATWYGDPYSEGSSGMIQSLLFLLLR